MVEIFLTRYTIPNLVQAGLKLVSTGDKIVSGIYVYCRHKLRKIITYNSIDAEDPGDKRKAINHYEKGKK